MAQIPVMSDRTIVIIGIIIVIVISITIIVIIVVVVILFSYLPLLSGPALQLRYFTSW